MENNINKLCGFDRPVPALYKAYGIGPGEKVLKGRAFTSCYAPEKAESAALLGPFLKAVALFCGADRSRRWALGKAADGSYICELASKSRPELLTICMWEPEGGAMKAVSYDHSTGQTLKYCIDRMKSSPARVHSTDSAALCLCMMQEVAKDEEAAALLASIRKVLEKPDGDVKTPAAKLCDNFYRRLRSGSLCVSLGEKGTPDQMNMAQIKNSAVRIREVFFGNFEQVGAETSETVEIKEGEYSLGAALSPSQQALVPGPIPGHVATKMEKEILEKIKRTRNLGKYAVRNFLIEGPPGTGKSQMVMDIARHLGLPYYEQGCSDGTNEDNITEYFTPKAESADEGKLLELLRRIPPEAEMLLSPEKAFARFTGEQPSGPVTAEDVKRTVLDAVKSAAAGGIRYEVHESPLLKCIRTGGVCDIAEAGSIVSPNVLTILNGILGTEGGTIDTPSGTVRRHPDCYLFVTNNPPESGGYKALDKAVRDRFKRVYSCPAPSKDEMIDRVLAQGFLSDEALIEALVRAIGVLDVTIREKGIRGYAGMRSLLEWAQDISFGDSITESMMSCVINGITTDEEEQEILLCALRENTEIFELDRKAG